MFDQGSGNQYIVVSDPKLSLQPNGHGPSPKIATTTTTFIRLAVYLVILPLMNSSAPTSVCCTSNVPPLMFRNSFSFLRISSFLKMDLAEKRCSDQKISNQGTCIMKIGNNFGTTNTQTINHIEKLFLP